MAMTTAHFVQIAVYYLHKPQYLQYSTVFSSFVVPVIRQFIHEIDFRANIHRTVLLAIIRLLVVYS